MTFDAGVILGSQGRAPAFECRPFVRIVAITAIDLALRHRVMVGQVELGPHFQMALETTLRGLARIDDRVARTARLIVQAARSMTGFAAHFGGVAAFRFEPRMGGGPESLRDVLVALGASLGSDKSGARNLRRRDQGAIHRRTRNQERPHQQTGDRQPGSFALAPAPRRNAFYSFKGDGDFHKTIFI